MLRRFSKKFVLALVMLVSVGFAAEAQAGISVIPQPQAMKELAGNGFTLTPETTIIYGSKHAKGSAEMLAGYLRPATGFALDVKAGRKAGKNSLFLSVSSANGDIGQEGYTLKVTSDGAVIKSSHAAGLFYGVQTIRQLLPVAIYEAKLANGVDWVIPGVSITDEPRFGWRAFMLDEARHFKGADVVKSLLDQMSSLKMNVFHWHLVDDQGWRIEIKKYPKLTEIGSIRHDTQIGGWKSEERTGVPHKGFYTQEQIKEIVRYAADRHITIVPEIEMPGHASAAIAAYPELSTKREKIEVPDRFGKHQNCFNPADENVYRILSDILDEVVALFPGEVIHIGGDEVRFNHWKESDEIKQLMEREGLATYADVQIYFTNRMSHIIEEKGRRMMGWNEILGHDLHGYLKDGQTAKAATLSTNAVIHFWKGSPELAQQAAEKGHEVVNSWHSYTYLDYGYNKINLQKAYGFDPVMKGLAPKYHSKIKGFGCQMWGEWIPTVEIMEKKVYPRLAAYAEVGWTALDQKDYDSFVDRMSAQYKRWDIQSISYGASGGATRSEKALYRKDAKVSDFHGYKRYDFKYKDFKCYVIEPKKVQPSKPWVWRARFDSKGAPEFDVAMLKEGYHIAKIGVNGLLGGPEAMERFDMFYKYLTNENGFSTKPVLEGLSRGGLPIFNWSIKNPKKVACVYGDAAVCDFKSWPGGKGKGKYWERGWELIPKLYGLTKEERLTWKGNPVDNVQVLAKAGVAVIFVVGDADLVVPPEENALVMEKRYNEALPKGGTALKVIHKPGVGHHPPGLSDPSELVEFVKQAVKNAK